MPNLPFQHPTFLRRIRVLVQLLVIVSLVLGAFQPVQAVHAKRSELPLQPQEKTQEDIRLPELLLSTLKDFSFRLAKLSTPLMGKKNDLNPDASLIGPVLPNDMKALAVQPAVEEKTVLPLQTSLLQTSFDFANNDPQGWVWTYESGRAHGEVANERLYIGGGGTWSKGKWTYSYDFGSNRTGTNARFRALFHHNGNNFPRIGVIYRDGSQTLYTSLTQGDIQIDLALSANKEIATLLFGTSNINSDGSWIDNVVLEGIQSTRSEIHTDKETATADNMDAITITVTARDAAGNPLNGNMIRLDASGEGNTFLSPNPAATDPSGIVSFTLVTTRAETKTLSAVDITRDVALDVQKQIQFIAGSLNPGVSQMSANPLVSAADGIAEIDVTVTAYDTYQNPVSGKTVILTVDPSLSITLDQPENPTDQNGRAVGSIRSSEVQEVQVGASIDGVTVEQTVMVRFAGTDLQIVQSAEAPTNNGLSGTIATAGYPITYTIDITNIGAVSAAGVVVTDTLANGLTFQSGSEGCAANGQVVTCPIGEVAASGSKRITLTAGIASELTGQISNFVEVTGIDQPPSSSILQTEVVLPQAALAFQVKSISPYARPGSTTIVTAELVNRGLAPSIQETLDLQGPLSSWVTVEPSNLPALAKDETTQVTITIAPPNNQPFGQYQGLIRFGAAQIPMVVFVGDVRQVFSISVNTDSATPSPVSGANLQLIRSGNSYVRVDLQENTSSYLPVYTGKTDENGLIVFDQIEAGTYTYNLSADYHDTEIGTLTVGNGTPDTVTIAMTPYGFLYLERYQRIMTVLQEGQVDQTLILHNRGAAPIDGLQVQIEPYEAQALPDWIQLIIPSPIPVLQPGEKLPITISAQPGSIIGDFPIMVRIKRDSDIVEERVDIPAPINIVVTSNATRDVLFSVVDGTMFDPATQALAAVQSNGRVIVTRMRPQNLTLDGEIIQYQPQYSLPLDGSGQALFTGLEIGETYQYQMWADNYDYQEGSLIVSAPGEESFALASGAKLAEQLQFMYGPALQTLPQNHQISTEPQPFIYTWRVIEGTTDLTYKLELTINNPDGSMVTQRPDWCLEENGCFWDSAGSAISFGGSSGGGWYSIPGSIPRPTGRLASIQLSQSIVLSWQMFTGSLWLQNTSSSSLDNMRISVLITDSGGQTRAEDFTIQAVGQPQGVAVLEVGHPIEPGMAITQDWQILPKGNQLQATKYSVYAKIEYSQNGVHHSFVTTSEGITVNPAPKLSVVYTIPVSESPCGVFDVTASITNVGAGTAQNLRIDSQPPRVTTLDGGPPITAHIVEARIGEQVQPNALALTLGDLPSGATVEAAWTIHTSEPVAVINVTGLLWQDDPANRKIAAINDFQVRMEPGSCRSMPEGGTRDGGGACGENGASQPSGSYGGASGSVGGPINTRTGSADYSYSDLSLATYAGTLEFKRWYSTAAVDTFQEPFSPGWVHNQDVRLILPAPGKQLARVKLNSTNEYEFFLENGQFTAFPGFFGKLEHKMEGAEVLYTFTGCDQRVYTFNASGQVVSLMDTVGKGYLYEYDAQGRMWKIYDNHPDPLMRRGIELVYNPTSGKLIRVDDSAGRQVRFEYDGNGDLQYFYDVQGQRWVYTYFSTSSKAHLLQSVGVEVVTSQGPEVRIIERNVYNDDGQVIAQYNGSDELVVALAYGSDGVTTITDGLGNVSTHQYSIFGTLIGETNPLGNTQIKDYSNQFRPTMIKEPNGNTTHLEWDQANNQATLKSLTDAAGGTLHFDYDTLQNLTSFTDQQGNASSFTYEDTRLTSFTDALGTVTTYEYTNSADAPQPIGLLKQITSPTGQVTLYHYNLLGQVEWVQQDGLRTSFAYDINGRVARVTSPTGSVSTTCYDAAGRTTRTVNSPSAPAGNPCESGFQPRLGDQVSNSYYDALGNLIAILRPDGILIRTYYDAANRPIRVTQNLKNPTNPDANISDLLALASPPTYNPAHPTWNLTSETRYDASGNLIARISVDGTITRTYYDSLGRAAFVVQNLTGQDIEVTTLPPSAMRTAEQNLVSQTVYDINGNNIASIEHLQGCVVTETQGADGIATLSINDRCYATRTYYDELDRPYSAVQNWRGADLLDPTPPQPEASRSDRNQRTDTVYDLAGNPIASIRVLPGCEVTRTVDVEGNRQVTTTPDCVIDRSYYDRLNRVEFQVSNLLGMPIEAPAYAEDGILALLSLERTEDQNLTRQTVYDSGGRIIANIDLLPGCTVSRVATGGRWTYSASEACQVTRTYYDAQGRTKLTVQNLRGQLIDETLSMPPAYDPNFPDQNVPGSQPQYDASGRSIASIDPLGHVNRIYFDLLQRPYKQTQNLVGQTVAVETPPLYNDDYPDQNVTSETRYDNLGRVIATIDPLGNVTRTYYDELGRVYQTTRNLRMPALSIDELLQLDNPPAFDPTHPDWNITTETVFDAADRVIASIDKAYPGCEVYHNADGTVTASSSCEVTRSYYDSLGRVYATVERFSGQSITDSPVPSINLTNETNLRTFTVYDTAGQAIVNIPPDPACIASRASDGSWTIGANCVVNRSYFDELGRVVTVVRNLRGQDYQIETPPTRELRQPSFPYYEHPDQNLRMDMAYDASGNLVEQVDAEGIITRLEYDRQNRLTDVIENYRPGFASSENINVHTIYTYDAQGNRLTIHNARAVLAGTTDVTRFTYNALSQLISERDPLNHGRDYGYNALGQVEWQKDAYGLETRFTYDGLGRLVGITYPAPDAPVSFRYGPTGLRNGMTDGLGDTAWEYDALGRILSVTDTFDKTVAYLYDGQSNRTRLTYPDGKTVNYEYDDLNRLQTVTDWQSNVTSYTYDGVGRLYETQLPNGVISSYDYDPAGRLVDIRHTLNNLTLAGYHYHYDLNGNRVRAVEDIRQPGGSPTGGIPAGWTAPDQFTVEQQGYLAVALAWPQSSLDVQGYTLERSTDGEHWQTLAELSASTQRYVDYGLARHTDYSYRLAAADEQGNQEVHTAQTRDSAGYELVDILPSAGDLVSTTIDYTYDPIQRLTAADYDNGQFFHYEYDANGNRTAETTKLGRVSSVYDSANRLIGTGEINYTWDDNGNLLGDGRNSFAYDRANRLVKITQGDLVTTYGYNGLGDRLKENGTQYVLDLNNGLTQALQDGQNSYLYGSGRIAQVSAGKVDYFIGDILGSVRQLTDSEGEVTLARSYEPYGSGLQAAGNGQTVYGFTGEPQDSRAELIYLRSRYYSTGTGRFLSRDTWTGDETAPMSYNAWLYGYSNPVFYTDPTGQNPLALLLPGIVGGAAGFLVGIAVGGTFGACTYELALAGECGCDLQEQALSMTEFEWVGAHALGAGVIGGVAGAIAAYGPIGLIAVGVVGVVVSGVDIVNTVNIIRNETGITTCTVARLILDAVGIIFSVAGIGYGIVKGVRAWRAGGSLLKWVNTPPQLSGKSALDSMYSQSRPGVGKYVREVPKANPYDWFYKIADPSSIKPHPNPKVASQGGLSGTIPGGGQIFYRPYTSSGNPAIDTFNVPGYTVDWKYHFPLK